MKEKALWLVVGMPAAGLATWLVAMFPCFYAALFGSLVAHAVMYDSAAPKKRPTAVFFVAWIGGAVTVATISWLNSLVPPLGCILSACLGGVAMVIANFFREGADDCIDPFTTDDDDVSRALVNEAKTSRFFKFTLGKVKGHWPRD